MPNKPAHEMNAEELEQCAANFRAVYADIEEWMTKDQRERGLMLTWDQVAWVCWGIRMMCLEIDARREQEDQWLSREASRQKQH